MEARTDPESIRAVVVDELSRAAKVDLSTLPDDAQLRDDVPIDSLTMLQVFLKIEKRLGLEIDENALSGVRTLGDLVACIAASTERDAR